MVETIITRSANETQEIAADFLNKISVISNKVVLLYGDLGSGKTTFVQGVARALGISEKVQSPTFVIIKKYNIKISKRRFAEADKSQNSKLKHKIKKLIHIDLYRLKSSQEVQDIGIDEYFSNPSTITFIEWPKKIEKILPKDTIRINFKYLDEDKRKIIIVW